MSDPRRIDVHQHLVPPFWAEALPRHGGDPSGWHSPAWTPEAVLRFMDEQRIATGILSLTAPSVTGWRSAERREMARRVNTYVAELVAKTPSRFGNFATVPLPDVDAAVAEIDHAFDALSVDGVVLLTNHDGIYLGDPRYAPVWEALARRAAVVFLHPAAPPIDVVRGMPGPIVDYPFDTTRTAVHMVLNGVVDRYPEVKIILSHAGGFLPYASRRFAELSAALDPNGPSADALIDKFQRFYFDTALSTGAAALPSLMAFARQGHVLYGSDFPYAPAVVGASFTAQLDSSTDIADAQRARINRSNALALFDRLRP